MEAQSGSRFKVEGQGRLDTTLHPCAKGPASSTYVKLKHRRYPSSPQFILQAELLRAYRAAVRATRREYGLDLRRSPPHTLLTPALPDPHTRRETLDWLRSDIERLRGELDDDVIRSNLSTFQRNLKTFGPSLGISGLSGQGAKLIGQRR